MSPVPVAPRRHRAPHDYLTPAARRLRTGRSRRRGRLARLAERMGDYTWLLRQTLGALALFILGFAVLSTTAPGLAGLREEVGYYLTTDLDLRGATRAVFSGDLGQKLAQGLRIFPDLWERLTGGADDPPPQEASFILPVTGGTVTSGFGYRPDPITAEVAFHAGIDIAAEEGTPVLAALGGTVLSVDDHESYGKVIEVDHGRGIVTLYAHCAEVRVSPGDPVAQGDEIATVGMTGRATTPHCHFEVIVAGQPVDPMQFRGLAPGEE